MFREIVKIDEEKCDGCGLCVPACAEGAIQIVDGKARLLADNLCDGLGACLGHCPKDAIIIENGRPRGLTKRRSKSTSALAEPPRRTRSCPRLPLLLPSAELCCAGTRWWLPSARLMTFDKPAAPAEESSVRTSECVSGRCRCTWCRRAPLFCKMPTSCWPPTAFLSPMPIFTDFLQGRALLIGCPKLDDGQAYLQKLTAILTQNDIRSLTVLHMEVPCCSGLIMLARQAIAASGKSVPLETVRIGVQGERK
jgi:NAD-dependent dihydropyrimidine dehydrogenase PreA subunit